MEKLIVIVIGLSLMVGGLFLIVANSSWQVGLGVFMVLWANNLEPNKKTR